MGIIVPMSTTRPQESDIGKRVSIRVQDPEGGFRDFLGILVTLTTVEKKDGSVHQFDPAKIAVWKVVPNQTTMRIKRES
jgi:hypothetical protein